MILRRSIHNPFAMPHNGIPQVYDPRKVPHANFWKWARFPDTIQHDPEKVGLRCTRNPLMIPHNDILQGYDPRTHPHTHLCK